MVAFISYIPAALTSTVFVTFNDLTAWRFDMSSVVEKNVRKIIALRFEHTGSKYSTEGPFSSYVFKNGTAVVRVLRIPVKLDNSRR